MSKDQKVYTITEGQLEYIEQFISETLIEMYWLILNRTPVEEEKLQDLNQSILADLNSIRYLEDRSE